MGSHCPPRARNCMSPGEAHGLQDAKGRGNYPSEPSIQDVEIWLDWPACQMDMPHWWKELTTILGMKDPWKLAWKIHASFSILAVRSKVFPGQGYTAPLPPSALPRMCFSWMNCPIRMCKSNLSS